ncbi:MAG TPA: VOC family protein [Xanthobacteraceae bacterium]|nr:VOC family protein [Xanthobacteraceae bacterium]
MPVPSTNLSPAFDITRASHIVLTVRDPAVSRAFYTEVIGLQVSDEGDDGEIYLRGVEETCHHSLVLRQAAETAVCETLGFRVRRDEDLDRAKRHFDASGIESAWVTRPFQGRTLKLRDRAGMPLELCASMPTQPRLHDKPHLQRGAGALRYDHVQCLVPDVAAAGQFYADLGFRVSDYFVERPEDDDPLGLFLFRKNNPHDIVLLTRPGPRMHHFGYIVAETHHLFRALDTAGAIGFAANFERGPGRHGQGHVFYVYFRDPDGHRVEILPPPIQIIDLDDVPQRWHSGNRFTWDLPPPKKWLYQATPFHGAPIRDPKAVQKLYSLEDFLNTVT